MCPDLKRNPNGEAAMATKAVTIRITPTVAAVMAKNARREAEFAAIREAQEYARKLAEAKREVAEGERERLLAGIA